MDHSTYGDTVLIYSITCHLLQL